MRQFLATRRPDIRFDDLDEKACQVAFRNGIAPINFVLQTDLPLRPAGNLSLPADPFQDSPLNRKYMRGWLAGLVIFGLVICLGFQLLKPNKAERDDRVPTATTHSKRPKAEVQRQMSSPYTSSNPPGATYTPPTVSTPNPPEDTQPVETTNSPTQLPPEPAPAPIHHLQGKVKLSDARLSIENDGNGHEQVVGRVLIENTGDYPILDFRLSLEAGTGEWALIPFEGSLQYPTSIYSRRIEPGGSMEVPVMTGGYYTSYSAYGVKKINIEATVDGSPSKVFDSATVL